MNLVRDDVADLDGADIAPAIDTIDEAAFVVAGRDVIRVRGRSGGTDQRASGKADAEAGTEMRVGMGLGLAANGGEGGGKSEGCEGGSDGFGLGHGTSPTVANWGGRQGRIAVSRGWRKKGSKPAQGQELTQDHAYLQGFPASGAQELSQPFRPETKPAKAGNLEKDAEAAGRPGEIEQAKTVDQRRDRGHRDGDRQERLRHVELVVAEVEPVIFLFLAFRLGAGLFRACFIFLDIGLELRRLLGGERLVEIAGGLQ